MITFITIGIIIIFIAIVFIGVLVWATWCGLKRTWDDNHNYRKGEINENEIIRKET